MSIESIRAANPGFAVRSLDEEAFGAYGRVLQIEGLEGLVELADAITSIDAEANRYVASQAELEAHASHNALAAAFGYVDIQVGYCNGPNSALNGLEYHKSAEIDVAVTDLVLLLGLGRDIGAGLGYESRRLECFFVPRGCAIELFPEVLHYAPCRALEGGFKSLVVLPRGTNSPLSAEELAARPAAGEGRLLFMRNKWLLAHPERRVLVEKGAWPGIVGENMLVRL
jgi:hypothetical protein